MLVFLSATLYGFALTQPALNSGDQAYTGWDCLRSGLLDMVAWYANPLLLFAWILILCRNWLGAPLAACSLTAAISFTGLTPSRGDLGELRLGYWLWMASISVALVAGLAVAIASVVEESRRTRETRTV